MYAANVSGRFVPKFGTKSKKNLDLKEDLVVSAWMV